MEPGDVVGERFELLELARRGGMGAVFRARDRKTDAQVAVKGMLGVASTEARRFMREARVLAELSHPGVVRYVAAGDEGNGELYLVMEWLEGEDLARALARGPLTIDQSVTLARRVAGALAAAHGRGVIHRDIKPSNIFLPGGDPARTKLLDFGVARLEVGSITLTGSTQILGTAGYMAPEQIDGSRHVDRSSDVFSLGCVLFECLTGQQAFPGENMMAVMAKVVCQAVPPVRQVRPEVPLALEDLLARMLAKERAHRPRDGGALLAELDALSFRTDASTAAHVDEASTPLGPRARAVVLVDTSTAVRVTDETLNSTAAARRRASVWAIASSHGAEFGRLTDGALVITLAHAGPLGELAERAANCALALRQAFPSARVALALASDDGRAGPPLARVIDRAAALLGVEVGDARTRGPEVAVRTDPESARWLGAQHVVLLDGPIAWLSPPAG